MLTVLIDRTVTNAYAVYCFTFVVCMCISLSRWANGPQYATPNLMGFRNNGAKTNFSFYFLVYFEAFRPSSSCHLPSLAFDTIIISFGFFYFSWFHFGSTMTVKSILVMCMCGCGCVCYLSCLDAVFFTFLFCLFVLSIFILFTPLPPVSILNIQLNSRAIHSIIIRTVHRTLTDFFVTVLILCFCLFICRISWMLHYGNDDHDDHDDRRGRGKSMKTDQLGK